MERILGFLLALIPLVVAVWFASRQGRLMRKLRDEPHLPPEDQTFYRRALWRRWLYCFLLLVLAVMLGGLFGMDIYDELDRLMAVGRTAKAEQRELTPEEKDFLIFGINYVLVLMLVLVLVLVVAVIDLMAIRRYGMRHRKRIREDRQAMLERQLPQLYQERRLKARDEQDNPSQDYPPPEPSPN